MLKTTCIAGFAMFSMFFGSGNLVFPLLLGTQTLDQLYTATGGFFVTAVLVPFLGLLAMIIFDGNREKFFTSIGKIPGFLLTFAMLALIGPLGAVPRCITVAYGGLTLVFPELSFAMFSAIFTVCIGGLVWQPNRIVNIIGVFLTPLKLGGLAILIAFGLYFAQMPSPASMTSIHAFGKGFSTGYHTMDLIAAFFFSATIMAYLKKYLLHGENQKALFKSAFSASLIGAGLLVIVYFCFVQLGASYAPHLTTTNPESLLAAIAGITMGKYALSMVAFTLAVSCLATAVILTSLFVDFLYKDIAKERLNVALPYKLAVVVTLVATYAVSLLGFSRISAVLGTILEVSYPALIVLSLHHILAYFLLGRMKINCAKTLFWSVLALSAFFQFWG